MPGAEKSVAVTSDSRSSGPLCAMPSMRGASMGTQSLLQPRSSRSQARLAEPALVVRAPEDPRSERVAEDCAVTE
jgi:hypothetical protein